MRVGAPRIHRMKPDNLEKACKNLAVNWIRMCASGSYLSKGDRGWGRHSLGEKRSHVLSLHVRPACYPLVTSWATGLSADLTQSLICIPPACCAQWVYAWLKSRTIGKEKADWKGLPEWLGSNYSLPDGWQRQMEEARTHWILAWQYTE